MGNISICREKLAKAISVLNEHPDAECIVFGRNEYADLGKECIDEFTPPAPPPTAGVRCESYEQFVEEVLDNHNQEIGYYEGLRVRAVELDRNYTVAGG